MNPLRIVHKEKKAIEASRVSPEEQQLIDEIRETMVNQLVKKYGYKRKPKPINRNAS